MSLEEAASHLDWYESELVPGLLQTEDYARVVIRAGLPEPPTVCIEGFTGALYLDKPREIERYDAVFANLWESSLDERASQELIFRVARELEK
ncbi:MAG: Scr1 family TA system antitoxin-like transcriptional regulator [Pseudonocardiales bacterium]